MAAQASELRECEIGITPFDCPRDMQVSDFGSVVGLLAAEVMARYQVLRDPDDVGRSTGGEEGGGDV